MNGPIGHDSCAEETIVVKAVDYHLIAGSLYKLGVYGIL
jgi:hypothetical protein